MCYAILPEISEVMALCYRGVDIMDSHEEPEVLYANLVKITHAGIEFILDFKRLGPEYQSPESAPTALRVILHPVVAKAFRDALTENVQHYENTFGVIPPAPQPGRGSGQPLN
jgi:hypothetical protein